MVNISSLSQLNMQLHCLLVLKILLRHRSPQALMSERRRRKNTFSIQTQTNESGNLGRHYGVVCEPRLHLGLFPCSRRGAETRPLPDMMLLLEVWWMMK